MNKRISNIVFTKNRPLQLEAYLESLYRFFPEDIIQTYIIYKPELFSDEYKQLFGKYSDCIVIKESDFHSDCINVIQSANTKYILFGIDDVVFFDSVDFEVIEETFEEHGDDIFGFSLRFSVEGLKKSQELINTTTINGQKVHNLNWTQGNTPTTRYPFELCATVYKADLVKMIINSSRSDNPLARLVFLPDSALIKLLGAKFARKVLKKFGFFYSPNTLESWNCRWCQQNCEILPKRLYSQKQCATAIQVNMVNTTTKDSFDGSQDLTVEALNEKYKQDHRLNIEYVAQNKPVNTHCDREYFKLKTKEP